MTPSKPTALNVFSKIGAKVFFFLFFYHFYMVWAYGLRIPIGDEWAFLDREAFEKPLLEWIFTPHNDHLITLTKLIARVLYSLNGWNLWWEQLITFFFFGALLFALNQIAKAVTPSIPRGLNAAFLIFLLSSLTVGLHATGFNTQYHGAILFKFLGVLCLFHPRPRPEKVRAGFVFLTAGVFCFGSGRVVALTVTCIFLLFQWLEDRRLDSWEMKVGGFFLLCLGLVNYGFFPTLALDNALLPHTQIFWVKFGQVVGWPLLHQPGLSPFPAYLALILLVLLPLALCLRIPGVNRSREFWLLVAAIAATLAELVAVTIGRGRGTEIGTTSAGRYNEFGLLLIPLAGLAWAKVLEKTKWLFPGLLALWLFFAVQFRDNWKLYEFRFFMHHYKEASSCLYRYYENGGAGLCPLFYPFPLGERLDRAKTLNLDLYRAIIEKKVSAVEL